MNCKDIKIWWSQLYFSTSINFQILNFIWNPKSRSRSIHKYQSSSNGSSFITVKGQIETSCINLIWLIFIKFCPDYLPWNSNRDHNPYTRRHWQLVLCLARGRIQLWCGDRVLVHYSSNPWDSTCHNPGLGRQPTRSGGNTGLFLNMLEYPLVYW